MDVTATSPVPCPRRPSPEGFTLIELLVVIAIVELFRGDATVAIPEMYESLEAEGYRYAILSPPESNESGQGWGGGNSSKSTILFQGAQMIGKRVVLPRPFF